MYARTLNASTINNLSPPNPRVNVRPMKVIPISAPDADIIEVIEDALARAKRGELRAVVVVAKTSDNRSLEFRARDNKTEFWELVPSLEWVKLRCLGVITEADL